MKLRTLALAASLAIAGNAYAAVNTLALVDTLPLGSFGAPTLYSDAFAVSTPGNINHSLTFSITAPLYAGSGISDVPLSVQFSSFTLTITDITGLSAKILDNNNATYATFISAGNQDYLTLPPSTFFAAGNYTLNVTGSAVGTSGGMYTVSAVTVPVPEPETWGMLLAGMGLVALRVRQKAKAARA